MLRTFAVAFALVVEGARALNAQALPFDAGWRLTGELTRVEEFRGRRALRIRTGTAVREGVRMLDGTLDFDVMLSPHRSFVYIYTRMQDENEHEEMYLRSHKSELPDAVQYSPVWNGDSNWQLYHGPGMTAAVRLPHNEWTHVRVVLRGQRAALFIGDTLKPALVVRLQRDPMAGHIALGAFVPPGTQPDKEPFAAFANVRVRPDVTPFDFATVPERDVSLPEGMITRWQLSGPYAPPRDPAAALSSSTPAERVSWKTYASEPNGVLVIGRHVKRPAPNSAIVARLVIRAERDTVAPLQLGFSDIVTVYLTGRALISADARYSFDAPRQEGLIGLSQATIYLPLRQGENEVLIHLSDSFGGWGLMGRLVPGYGAAVVR
ncbi:MAG TPA: hypothetical protein VJ717_09630 [Gemmatimonadaceae bacterium]|nr:hypothetical protein [Gemmatimonadaceae bacterium]